MEPKEIIKKLRERLEGLDNPELDNMMDHVKEYLDVGKYLPTTINFERPKTIRQAQKALKRIEKHLDIVVPLHHDAKRVLQIIASVEFQLLGVLVRSNYVSKNASGPIQKNAIAAQLPKLGSVKSRWEALDKICTQAQQRLASARESLKLQAKLDDNLRWAQDRQPS